MDKKEKILCAAIHVNDPYDFTEYKHQPINIQNGFVLCGFRHSNCYAILKLVRPNPIYCEEGFLTSLNRFIDRTEAAKIALESNQISEAVSSLHSEDLW